MNYEKRTQSVSSQVETIFPDFVREDESRFVDFVRSYYESLERPGQALDLLYNISDYFDLDNYTPEKLTSSTLLIENTEKDADSIVVSTTKGYLSAILVLATIFIFH